MQYFDKTKIRINPAINALDTLCSEQIQEWWALSEQAYHQSERTPKPETMHDPKFTSDIEELSTNLPINTFRSMYMDAIIRAYIRWYNKESEKLT